MVVELMRSGMEPEQACKEIVNRINKTNNNEANFQVGFIALRKDGAFGAYSLLKGFNYAVYDKKGNNMIDCPFYPQ